MPRYRSRTKSNKDANHDEVKAIFTAAMYYTLDTCMLDCGFDFIAWRSNGLLFLVEVKNDSLSPSATKLTILELEASKKYPNWRRIGSVEQAIHFVQNNH